MAELRLHNFDSWPHNLSSNNFNEDTPFWDLQIKNNRDGVIMYAHKVVMCTSTGFFAGKSEFNRVRMNGITSDAIEAALKLIYTGKVRLSTQ